MVVDVPRVQLKDESVRSPDAVVVPRVVEPLVFARALAFVAAVPAAQRACEEPTVEASRSVDVSDDDQRLGAHRGTVGERAARVDAGFPDATRAGSGRRRRTMITPSKKIHVEPLILPKLGEAPIEELKRRCERLRRAIVQERVIAKIIDIFHDDFANELELHERSHPTEDASFHAILGQGGVLRARFGEEVFDRRLLYCPELRLFHGSVRSANRFGVGFQFEGDTKGVISVSTFTKPGKGRADCFRYSILPTKGPISRGGLA